MNNKAFAMKQGAEIKKDEPVFIPDECGDTMWDAVLQQEAGVKSVSEPAAALLNRINAISRKFSGSDTSKAQ
jgi:cobalamin biosynthesis protein CbiG